jgi:hypothetical protein
MWEQTTRKYNVTSILVLLLIGLPELTVAIAECCPSIFGLSKCKRSSKKYSQVNSNHSLKSMVFQLSDLCYSIPHISMRNSVIEEDKRPSSKPRKKPSKIPSEVLSQARYHPRNHVRN